MIPYLIDYLIDYLMIIQVWWLFDLDYLISNNHQIIQIFDILFDDYLSYLMIIWLLIWLIIWWLFQFICDYSSESLIICRLFDWLFDDYFSESLIIWWLFDDYLMIILIIWWLFAISFRLISVLIPQQPPSRYHAGPAYIVGYKLSATWSQAAMERQIQSRQQDLASALAAAPALLLRDNLLDPSPWTPTSD